MLLLDLSLSLYHLSELFHSLWIIHASSLSQHAKTILLLLESVAALSGFEIFVPLKLGFLDHL